MGHRAWSVGEKETYALVSCLLKFKSWLWGRQVTVFTDHKSLESWYKEELCTMLGPLGRHGRWHDFLSRYNIVVVYKPGVQNDAADRMSRWAYPAGLADDTNCHGSDACLEGVSQWEASERQEEQQLITENQYPRKILEVRAPILSPRKLHPLFSPKHLDFVTEKNIFFCHLENTVFQTLPKNAFFIRFAHFLLFLGGSNNHSLVQNQRVYRSFSPKKSFVG